MIEFAMLRRCLLRVRQATSAPRRRRAVEASWLAEAIGELPEPARAVYLLSARDELPLESIARRLGLPVSVVEVRLANALVLIADRDNAVASRSAVK